jgi:vesicle transport through interaction with t-SNAREs protein 1
LDEVDDHVRTSRTILTGMARRVATNKMILAFIILLLVAAIGSIIYLKWIK